MKKVTLFLCLFMWLFVVGCGQKYDNLNCPQDTTLERNENDDGIQVWCIDQQWLRSWPYRSYYKNWQLDTEWFYENDELTWQAIIYYENWQIEAEMFFKNWIVDWTYINYYKNGRIARKGIFDMGLYNWKWISYYENGQIESELIYKDDLLDGYGIYYRENWQKEAEWNWENDIQVWKWTYYYEDWQKEAEWNWENGIRVWKFISYHENWQIEQEWNYEDDMRVWKWISYHENWQKESEWNWENDMQVWKWIYYHENWQIEQEWNYEDDMAVWEWVFYYENWDKYNDEASAAWNYVLKIDSVLYKCSIDHQILQELFSEWQFEKLEKILDTQMQYCNFNLKSLWSFEWWESLRNKAESIMNLEKDYYTKMKKLIQIQGSVWEGWNEIYAELDALDDSLDYEKQKFVQIVNKFDEKFNLE